MRWVYPPGTVIRGRPAWYARISSVVQGCDLDRLVLGDVVAERKDETWPVVAVVMRVIRSRHGRRLKEILPMSLRIVELVAFWFSVRHTGSIQLALVLR